MSKKSTHFERLSEHIPNLKNGAVLDIGSGKGNFLLDAALHGAQVQGIEVNQENVDISKKKLAEKNFSVKVIKGAAENLPHQDCSFDFVNLAEVIEHVESPEHTLTETYRVLKPGGSVYISVPTRFSLKDPHFKLYFVNWLPRKFSDWYIGLFGKHKSYTKESGRQRLIDMHYYTLGDFSKLIKQKGFDMIDIRLKKIKENKILWPLLPIYFIVRSFYFDTYHLLLRKVSKEQRY